MNLVPRPQFVPADADRDTLIALLDADPAWERDPVQGTTPAKKRAIFWTLKEPIMAARGPVRPRVHVPAPSLPPATIADLCADTAAKLNALAFGLPPDILVLAEIRDAVLDRLIAIYQLHEPDSVTALIAAGVIEPEPDLPLALDFRQ